MAAYASLADLKEWLSIPAGTTTNDDLLTRLLDAATEFMDSYMNRGHLESASYTEDRDGNCNHRMMTRRWPITAVASVTINGQTVPQSTQWNAPGWVVDSTKDNILLRNRVFEKGVQNVRIEYTAGYATIPQDLQQACIELAGMKFKTRDTTAAGFVSKGLAGETISFSQKDMTSATKAVLTEYMAVFAV